MEFCPTKQERYAASLRQIVSRRIIKNGFTSNSLEQLKKICLFEAVKVKENCINAVELSDALDALLSAVFIRLTIRGISVKTLNSAVGCCALNKKILEMILAFCCNAKPIGEEVVFKVSKTKHYLMLQTFGLKLQSDIKKAAALAKGGCIRELKSEKYLIYLPIKSTTISERYYPSDAFIILSKGFQ